MTDEQTRRLNYAGAIGLLCECSVVLGNGYEADDLRDSIERAVADFCDMTDWTYRRVLDRIEVFPPQEKA
jgi:hypothetical protein